MLPKYFKFNQTKTQSRILKLVISLTGDRWDYSLRESWTRNIKKNVQYTSVE